MSNQRDLYLYTTVSSESIQPIVEAINFYNHEDNMNGLEISERQPINLFINCFGGELWSTYSLISTMERSKTPIHTYGQMAQSAGLTILACGHRRFGDRYGTFMYHESSQNIGEGKLSVLQMRLDEAKRLNELKNSILVKKTNITREMINNIVEHHRDWYFDSERALELGVIDEII